MRLAKKRRRRPMRRRRGLYAIVTDQIIHALNQGAGTYMLPWNRSGWPPQRPRSAATGKSYRGINVLALWSSASRMGFASPLWATETQWRRNRTPVLPGEAPTSAVFYRFVQNSVTGRSIRIARAFRLFNADQTERPNLMSKSRPRSKRILVDLDTLVRSAKPKITYGGDHACYGPTTDEILMPHRVRFTGSMDSIGAEAFGTVLLHELVHWTGAPSRLGRDLSGRFGSESYAMEELIAELGSAYLCADLGISSTPRVDHAQYVSRWLQVLRHDTRAVFCAAAHAERAASYLMGMHRMRPAKAVRSGRRRSPVQSAPRSV